MELNKAVERLKNTDIYNLGHNDRFEELRLYENAIDTVLNRLEKLENRYLHLLIGGRTYQILNDVKKLSYTEFEDGEVILEVLEKWN